MVSRNELRALSMRQAPRDVYDAAVEPFWTTDLAGLMADIPSYPEVRQVLDPWLQEIFDAVGS